MEREIITVNDFSYWEAGEGQPLILLHGLMGDLSNLAAVVDYFSTVGYQVIVPKLPIYTLPIINTNVKSLVTYLKDFIEYKKFDKVVLFGNSDFKKFTNSFPESRTGSSSSRCGRGFETPLASDPDAGNKFQ